MCQIHCKGCDFWSSSDDGAGLYYGSCSQLYGSNLHLQREGIDYILTGYGDLPSDYFLTREDFGCVLGKPIIGKVDVPNVL